MVDLTTVSYDCCQCGACCSSPWEGAGYVRLYDLDLSRLQSRDLPVVYLEQPGDGDQVETLTLLGTRLDDQGFRVCAAFRGSVGQACACTIYADRPSLCRQFEAGSALCRHARLKAGLPL
jgi:Fe-S-cluster containining protein